MQPNAAEKPQRERTGWFAKMALKDGLAKGGCLLCEAIRTSLRRYLFRFIYEGMMSGDVRNHFLEGGGFCREHFWQAKAIEEECWAEGIGVSILCENLVNLATNDLRDWTPIGMNTEPSILSFRRPTNKRRKVFKSNPSIGCIACATVENSEEHYLTSLEGMLQEPEFADRFRQSRGLCLQHLHAASGRWGSLSALELVKAVTLEYLRQLHAELQEFQRKHDYQYKHEPRGSEWSSPRRAIEFLVGPRPELSGFDDLAHTLRSRK